MAIIYLSSNFMKKSIWNGIRDSTKSELETRSYDVGDLSISMSTSGVPASDLVASRSVLDPAWIPGVEIFPRTVHRQKGRGVFSELVRTQDATLSRIGLSLLQWSSALMHRESCKGFHIHPPFIPEGWVSESWFQHLFVTYADQYHLRVYQKEQWDVMFILTSICELILVDERKGLPRRVMRFTVSGDCHIGPDNVGVIIPPGVGHALKNIGSDELIMVYGTSTTFNPDWEGRIVSQIETSNLPEDWINYLNANC
jgi:dTDP-4-dehydrorhamnose 3,5-epimerase-like enzyme